MFGKIYRALSRRAYNMVFILFHKGVQMLGKGILRNTYCDNRGLDNTIAI